MQCNKMKRCATLQITIIWKQSPSSGPSSWNVHLVCPFDFISEKSTFFIEIKVRAGSRAYPVDFPRELWTQYWGRFPYIWGTVGSRRVRNMSHLWILNRFLSWVRRLSIIFKDYLIYVHRKRASLYGINNVKLFCDNVFMLQIACLAGVLCLCRKVCCVVFWRLKRGAVLRVWGVGRPTGDIFAVAPLVQIETALPYILNVSYNK